MATWNIKRYIIEEYEVEADTRKDAKKIVEKEGDPHTITITKETIKKQSRR